VLEKIELDKSISKQEYKSLAKQLRRELSALQQQVLKQKLPVIILFEGWGASGKGELISDLILNFDPRWCTVHSVTQPTKLERRKPHSVAILEFHSESGQFLCFGPQLVHGCFHCKAGRTREY
jgi:AMP-polyphosphate phosphotransferase